jgi:STE24 endopeptidase
MKIICLIVILLTFFYSLFIDIIDLKSSNNKIHEKVSDIYDEEKYKKWKNYKKDGVVLSIVSSIVQFIVTMVFLVFDIYALVGNSVGDNVYLQTLVTISLYIVIDFIISTVISYIDTMVIEEKYGFNNTKLKLFIKDKIKSFILTCILMIGLLMLFVLIYESIGNYVILVFGLILVVIVLLVAMLSPYLMRISYKMKPLEDGELREKLTLLLQKYGFEVRSIDVLIASERTTKSNASFSGLGKTKTITLYDNLINSMTPDEIVAVFAHELGHGLHKDTLKLGVMSVVNILLIVLSMVFLINFKDIHIAFGFNDINYGFAFILLTYLFLPFISIITGLITNAISRKAEYEADNQAVKEGYGVELIKALKVLAKEDFADLSPSKLIVILSYSHPPMLERILNIEEQLKKVETK